MKERKLPDMGKVLAGLRICASEPGLQQECEELGCPYGANEIKCVVNLVRDAWKLLSALQPRPLTGRPDTKAGEYFLLWRGCDEDEPLLSIGQWKKLKGEAWAVLYLTAEGWRELDAEEADRCRWARADIIAPRGTPS